VKALVVKGSGGGGLGDSIRVVLVGILYSKLSGRSFFVDWSHGLLGEKNVNVFNLVFQLRGVGALDGIPRTDSVFPPSWRSRTEKSLNEVYRDDGVSTWDRALAIETYSFDLSKLDYSNEMLLMWEFDQLPKLRPYLEHARKTASDAQILGEVWAAHLRPHPSIQVEVDRAWLQIRGSPVIGVHVRMTSEFALSKGDIELSQYYSAIDAIRKRNPEAPIFLATDNSECKSRLMERYAGISTRPKWFDKPGLPLHLGDRCPDRLQATKDALVELLILSRCDYLVRPASSSFSMVAGIVGTSVGIKETLLSPPQSLTTRIRGRLLRFL
jgi:hypothetical protein